LSAGEYALVFVEQQDTSVIVEAAGTDGQATAEFQDELGNRGQVQIELVADRAGTYTLAVRLSSGAAPGSYAIRLANRRKATDADRTMQEVYTARTSALRLQTAGRLADAWPQLERVLTIAETLRGPDDLQVAAVGAQLAEVYLLLPDPAQSESLLRRVLSIREKALGAGHPAAAFIRARLAIVYYQAGQVAKAQELLLPALSVIEKSLGPSHPWVVRCLVTLANLRVTVGDLDQAEQINRRALAILDATDDHDSATYLGVLNNLGVIHRQKKDYGRAEEFFRRALAMSERQRGPESTDVARILSNLGNVANSQKDYASASRYYERALSIDERIVGNDHPDVATTLNNLAIALHGAGDEARSLDTHFRALRIREKILGRYHPGMLQSVGNIALMYWLAGDTPKAVAFQRRADAIVETQLALNLAVGSERQKLAQLNSISQRTDRTISLHVGKAPDDPDAGALAALVLLQRKGRVLDARARTFATVRERIAEPADRDLLDQLNITTAQLAKLALNPPEQLRLDDHRQSVAELEALKERLEAQLSEHDAEFRVATQPVTLEAVQAAIPEDGALIEYVAFRLFEPRREADDAYGAPHYAAYVLRRSGAPRAVDLGPATTIDAAIKTLRDALQDPKRNDVATHARALDEHVFRRLRGDLGGARRLLISPDGALNLVPFEALMDDNGQYLIERYAMSYLTSGRDLLRLRIKRGNGNPPLVIADPLFGEPRVASAGQQDTAAPSTPSTLPAAAGATTLSTIYFAPLPASAAEARTIKALFPDARVLMGASATKAALLRAEPPRMLHVASHGFFLHDAADDPLRAPDDQPADAMRPRSPSDARPNPLLRSGLAFAGANVLNGSRNDGILTALEASGLNLRGTKLVTLSACDTGVGDVQHGEGVYGLRRAFVLAGAETLVMSLWPVGDSTAREAMVRYYTGLEAGLGRGDALREAKLWMLKRRGRQHPFYWASFIQSGEWATLAGRR
jgi:CHAT domain-containing protein/Tfp pilus assembly protein PilF